MLRLDGAASVRLSVQLAGRCREVMSFLSGEEKVGKLLAASEILCAVTLNLALYWLIGARGGAKAVVGVLAFMVPLLLGSLLSPDILFIFRHLVWLRDLQSWYWLYFIFALHYTYEHFLGVQK